MSPRIFPLRRRQRLAADKRVCIKLCNTAYFFSRLRSKVKPDLSRGKPPDLLRLIRQKQRRTVINDIIAIPAAPSHRKSLLITVTDTEVLGILSAA